MTPTTAPQLSFHVTDGFLDWPRLFEQRVVAAPDATAIIFEHLSVTYRQLNQQGESGRSLFALPELDDGRAPSASV